MLVCISSSAYFAHHALHGRHGLEARSRLIDRSTLVEFEIRSLEAVRSSLAADVRLLATEPPHPDLVEEIARDVLGYARPGDRVIVVR
ncbi:MAG: septum formation initiator family protein [Hyphomicrobiaceae bacterium]|nr:septum formation initiator family protein [Hyphomicrobiaceae bacterium]